MPGLMLPSPEYQSPHTEMPSADRGQTVGNLLGRLRHAQDTQPTETILTEEVINQDAYFAALTGDEEPATAEAVAPTTTSPKDADAWPYQ